MGRPLIRSETRTRARTTITDMVCPEDPAYKVAKLADKLPQVLSFFIKKSFCEVFFSDAILLVVPYVNFFQKGILKSLRAPLQKLVHFPSRFATQIDRMHDAGPPAPGRRLVAMGLELSGAGLLRGAFGSWSSVGPARRVTGSTFLGARPERPRGSRRSRRLGAGRGAAGWTSTLAAAERLGAWGGPSLSALRAGEADGAACPARQPPGSGPGDPVLPSQG